jgi:S-adenosylmethionine:tRNA ribosyltransferase-isomerase
MNSKSNTIQFELPVSLECTQPTEFRNIERDEVRLLVTTDSDHTRHTTFRNVDQYLQKGDVLVVNTSATRASALPVVLPSNRLGMAHFSTRVNDSEWLIEIREIEGEKTVRWKEGKRGMKFHLPDGADITLKRKFYKERKLLHLWVAEFTSLQKQESYLAEHAQPIKYDHLNEHYPLDFYQSVFSLHPGSSEMPSAGRGFTKDLVERLLEKGVVIAPILLHTGVSSLEENESPYAEYMEVDQASATLINNAKKQGRKIIAVGTTGIRAIESAVNESGEVIPNTGVTNLFIDNDYKMKVINGLLTGFHEPRASHLQMLQSLAGFDHIERAYKSALDNNYFWHQFGDLHLILPWRY